MQKSRKGRDQRLRDCMKRSLREWGGGGLNDANVAFERTIQQEAIEQANTARSSTFVLLLQSESLRKNQMPSNQEQAVKYVLRKELKDIIEEGQFEVVADTIGIPWPPFYQNLMDTTKYVRSKGYERFSEKDLDPLQRFCFKTLSAKQYIYKNWSDEGSLGGMVMEALVAHHVIHTRSCFHCESGNGLRWNGGRDTDSSWTDLLCLHCQSTFEVKSKRDAAALEKRLKFKELDGGSFRLFHANQFSKGKRYIVLVSRTANDRGEFPVSLTEIDASSSEPVLKDKSFATYNHRKKLSLGTKVRIKDRSNLWCTVPSPNNFHSLSIQWAKEVFDDHFGGGTWDSMGIPEIDHQQVNVDPHVESLRQDLEDLNTENWDDSDDEAA